MSRLRGNGEGSVYKSMERRKSGPVERWVAQVAIDGQKRRVMVGTEAQAKRELPKLMRSVDEGKPVSDGNLTLDALMHEWETKVLTTRHISASTTGRHRWAINILREDLGGTKLRTLTPDQVEQAFEARAEAGCARASIIKVRGTLSQILKWAIRRDLVTRNIAIVVELRTGARPTKEGRSLTPDQAKQRDSLGAISTSMTGSSTSGERSHETRPDQWCSVRRRPNSRCDRSAHPKASSMPSAEGEQNRTRLARSPIARGRIRTTWHSPPPPATQSTPQRGVENSRH